MAEELLQGDVWQFLDDRAVDLVRRYFDGGYTGAHFNSIGGRGDHEVVADCFDASDLVAVSTLSVKIPVDAAIEILEIRRERLSAMLAEIPNGVALHEADESIISSGSSASQLWYELKSIDGVGWVTAHKLLARKRPHLLPVYDSVVKAALQPTSDRFWVPLRNELRADDWHLVERLEQIRRSLGLADLSLIRVLDVAVWMRNRSESAEKLPFKPRS